jgi:predicted FMN-binding regulatory protein PaiB
MVEPGTGRHQEEKEELTGNQKERIVGTKYRLETLSMGLYKTKLSQNKEEGDEEKKEKKDKKMMI